MALRPSEDAGQGSSGGWIATALVGMLPIGGLLALSRWETSARAALLGLAAGLLYGIEAATLEVASDEVAAGVTIGKLLAPTVWITLMLAVAAVFVSNLSLRAGSLAVALSTITMSTPVASTVIGVAVFGEDLAVSQLTIASGIVTTAMAVVGVVILARTAASMAIAESVGKQTAR